jgi:hypothetical protein
MSCACPRACDAMDLKTPKGNRTMKLPYALVNLPMLSCKVFLDWKVEKKKIFKVYVCTIVLIEGLKLKSYGTQF